MRKGRFCARVEALETREVPSGVHAAILLGSPSSLHLQGTGTLVSQTAIPTGSYQTVSTLQGFSPAIGAFQARLVSNFAPDQIHVVSGSVLLVDQAGDQLLAADTGSFPPPVRGASHVAGALNFTVVAGSGAFANANGRGQIHLLQNVENGHIKFTLNAHLRAL